MKTTKLYRSTYPYSILNSPELTVKTLVGTLRRDDIFTPLSWEPKTLTIGGQTVYQIKILTTNGTVGWIFASSLTGCFREVTTP